MPKSLPIVLASLAASAAAQEFADFDAGEPVLVFNLALVPLFTRQAGPYEDFTVLEEAQAARAVRVRELGSGGEVPWLQVANRDARPLYLLGGEVLLGGQQDRMVVADTVIDGRRRARVKVACVEAGRWSGEDLAFRSSGAVAHPQLRKAALFDGQAQVWDEVARKSGASGVSSETGTYRRVVQDAAVRGRIARYLDELQARIPRDARLSGLAVAIDGELEVVDMFSSPLLYKKLERKLLTSYVLAALERQPRTGAAARAAEGKARALKKGDVEKFTPNSDGKTFRHKDKPVHGTYFKKK